MALSASLGPTSLSYISSAARGPEPSSEDFRAASASAGVRNNSVIKRRYRMICTRIYLRGQNWNNHRFLGIIPARPQPCSKWEGTPHDDRTLVPGGRLGFCERRQR